MLRHQQNPATDTLFFILIVYCSLQFGILLTAKSLNAADYVMAAGVGYDDNYALASESQGSGFAMYDFLIFEKIPLDISFMELTGFINCAYQDFFSISDNFTIKSGIETAASLVKDRLPVTIAYTGEIYRDREITEDDMKSHKLELTCKWSDFARFVPGCFYSFTWQKYDNALDTWTMDNPLSAADINGHGHGSNNGRGNENAWNGDDLLESSRDDRIWQAGFDLIFYVSPFLNTEFVVTHKRCSSSQKRESYSANCASFSLFQTFGAWELNALTGVKLFDYNWYPEGCNKGEKRKDLQTNGGIGVSYFIKKYELFIKADIIKNNSNETYESYLRRVLQCGISCAF